MLSQKVARVFGCWERNKAFHRSNETDTEWGHRSLGVWGPEALEGICGSRVGRTDTHLAQPIRPPVGGYLSNFGREDPMFLSFD